MSQNLSKWRKIVVKIGSSLLVDPQKGINQDWLESLLSDVAELKKSGSDVLIVSSGAIALGRNILKLPAGPLKLEEYQAAASVGQISLSGKFSTALGAYNFSTGQILLSLGDTEERRRYLNARATISTLLNLGAVPFINENDTVATNEIRYGDNDRLSARVATMAGADLLILLSDIDGLYTAPPDQDPDAKLIENVEKITPDIEAMAGDAGTELSRGGMKTKLEAAKIALAGGTSMIITSGKKMHPLKALDEGGLSTFFQSSASPLNARKTWIAGQLNTAGKIIVDDGAINALNSGKSLLPAGVTEIDGKFSRGDIVAICDSNQQILGQGISAYDAHEAKNITGLRSADIKEIIGYAGRSEMIHRDDMVLNQNRKAK